LNQNTTKYYEDIPEEIRNLLNGLSNEKNLAILIFLLKNGKKKFTEMKKEFKLSGSSLTTRLTELQDGNLVKNFYEKSGKKGFSYYDVTEFPELVFDSLFKILYSAETTMEKIDEKNEEKNISTRELISNIDVEQLPREIEKEYVPSRIKTSLTKKPRKYRIEEISYQGIRGSAT